MKSGWSKVDMWDLAPKHIVDPGEGTPEWKEWFSSPILSTLNKEIQVWDNHYAEMTGTARMKFVEKGGTKIQDLIAKINPWKKQDCPRDDCRIWGCVEGQGGKCKSEGVCYSLQCIICLDSGKEPLYFRESFRTNYERTCEHWKGHQKEQGDNPLWKHILGENQGVKQRFQAKVVSTHRKPLSCQVR